MTQQLLVFTYLVIPNNWMLFIIAIRRIPTVKEAARFQQGYGRAEKCGHPHYLFGRSQDDAGARMKVAGNCRLG
ncbi:uncharacterized protein PgNI_03875 [Pyricularia grisea]|uniref:Uncharacterized protein n=1 Tax=Pyricularia grisea TaxID=148305 RepID=A0A6P8B836_PYRGI|nr:uncharacterized protein PgNI_03875 [Pyricularia grisea]TLD11973.1 hypothetical protein PgNI_03875 [Pyricularia grisea]